MSSLSPVAKKEEEDIQDIEQDVGTARIDTDIGPESQRKLNKDEGCPNDQEFFSNGVFDYRQKFGYDDYEAKLNEIIDTPDFVDQMSRKMKDNFKPTEIEFRKEQLLSLKNGLEEMKMEIVEAMKADLGRVEFVTYMQEIYPVELSINHTVQNLKNWTSTKILDTPIFIGPGYTYLRPEPLGVVCIIGTWNQPFYSVFNPLVQAIAAGNFCVLKPSENAPHSSGVVRQLCEKYLDNQCYLAVEGKTQTFNQINSISWDLLVYQGTNEEGKIVAKAAAENLVPCLTDLGGKNPAIIDESSDARFAAKKVVFGKLSNLGQMSIAPDYVLCHESKVKDFIENLKETILIYSESQGKIISSEHYERLYNLLDPENLGPEHEFCIGNPKTFEDRYLRPTVVLNPSHESKLMQDEIFGPILPLITFKDVNEAIKMIQDRIKPQVIYYFGKVTGANKKLLEKKTSSGSFVVNETMHQSLNPNAPDGGVGKSGHGRTQGYEGFRHFSNMKSVFQKQPMDSYPLNLYHPPYTEESTRRIKKAIERGLVSQETIFGYFSRLTCLMFIFVFIVLVVAIVFGSRPSQPNAPTTEVQTLGSPDDPYVVVTVAWEPINPNGHQIQNYEIQVQASDKKWYVPNSCDVEKHGGGDQTHIILNMLTKNKCEILMEELWDEPFYLRLNEPVLARIRAENKIGWSDFSEVTRDSGLVQTKPGKPPKAIFEGENTDQTQIQIEWYPLEGDDSGQSPILSYDVMWDQGQKNWTQLVQNQNVLEALVSEGIESGKPYQFKYRAKNALGFGPYSDVETIYAFAFPEKMNEAVTQNEGQHVQVTWQQPPGDGGSKVTAFRVKVKDKEGEFVEEKSVCDGAQESIYEAMTCMIPMAIFTTRPYYLSVGASVIVAVEAMNAKGFSQPSDENTKAAIVQSAPLVGPPLYRGKSTNGQQIQVTWEELALISENGGAVIQSYQLEFCQSETDNDCYKKTLPADQTTYTFTKEVDKLHIVEGDAYFIKICAINLYGDGPFGQFTKVIAARTPDAPTGIVAGDVTKQTLTFSWDKPRDGGSPIFDYQITWNQVGEEFKVLANSTNSKTTYTATDLDPGKEYGFRVAAWNDVGLGEFSEEGFVMSTLN